MASEGREGQGSPVGYHKRRQLEQRIQKLLTKLRVLSEAESASFTNFNKGSAKAESKPPTGAFRRSGAPDPDDSLLAWFLYRLDKAKSDRERWALVLECELRLERRLHKQPGRIAGDLYEGPPESSKDRDKRIAEDYPGLSDEEVSMIETQRSGYCSVANVRLVRMRHRKDHEGHDVPPIPEKLEERIQLARRLKEENPSTSLADLAVRFGVSKATIHRWLGDKNGEKAA